MFFNLMNISGTNIRIIIDSNNLEIYNNVWHYTYNFHNNATYLFSNQSKNILLISKKVFNHAPALVFAKSPNLILKNYKNLLSEKFDFNNHTPRNVFWNLKISSFEDFLCRRSAISGNPHKHFPTIETYNKVKASIGCELKILEFDTNLFELNYNQLKKPDHLRAHIIIKNLFENTPELPINWVKIALLNNSIEVFAIAIIIDDGKSISLENIAAVRNPKGYGIYLCTEIVKYCCENNYYSFDAGISGIYGVYKSKIFLDSFEVHEVRRPFYKYANDYLQSIISRWKKYLR